ncbi:hypothetical protein AAHC03_023070 [Spirometra sp. Aus1]
MTDTLTISILDFKSEKPLATLKSVPLSSTIKDVKRRLHEADKRYKIARCSLRLTKRDKALADTFGLADIPGAEKLSKVQIYFKDLGPQVSWTTVFYAEYAVPPIVYAVLWLLRQNWMVPYTQVCPWLHVNFPPINTYVGLRTLAAACFIGHFIKRELETAFVHRFSHATMPLRNLFKNCSFYWLFGLFIAYFTNHHLYTFPSFGMPQVYFGLGTFLFGELGNFSCHIALRNLRPPGSTVRRIPQPVAWSPFTYLFHLVACPNYTYEVISWVGFTIMTQTLAAGLFTLFAFGQMTIWALNKLKAYRKEFPDFPKNRKAIIPFLL